MQSNSSQAVPSLKVLHVYRTYFPDTQGGLEEAIRQICVNTVDSGIENRVYTLSQHPDPSIIEFKEAKVFRFKLSFEIASCGISLTSLNEFKQLVKWADIVHYHFPWPFADFLHLAGRVRIPSVVTYHSDIVRQKALSAIYRPLMNHFLKRMDVIVPTSQNYYESSTELAKYADKVHVIPIGIEDKKLSFPESSERTSDLKAKYGENFVLFIGVLRYYKGLSYLLEALQGTSITCLIVGKGPEEARLKEQAKQLGLSQNVQFLGYLDDADKFDLLRLCRAVVFPSHVRSEAFGVTLLEGAIFSKPLISAELGTGTSFINKNGETGFVVEPANVPELRQAIVTLSENATLAREMGKAARRRYENLFTGKMMGEKYRDLYRSIVESSRNRS